MITTSDRTVTADVAERAIQAVIHGSLPELRTVIHPEAVNREAAVEPPDSRGQGPEAFLATSEWLRSAYAELAWSTERHVVEGDLAVTYGTMSGRHSGDFVLWSAGGTVERVFSPTGKDFAVRQAHFQRIEDGLVVEHWAVRDDQGQSVQLGWVPPTPAFLLRCTRATRRARRAARSD